MKNIFILPHINWTKKHGNVYCQICKDKTKKTFVPVTMKGIIFRREHATCKECMSEMDKKIEHYFKINYSNNTSQAAYEINKQFGIRI